MQYTVMLTKEDDGRYSVEVPALPGCQTYGNDLAHAMAMAKDAIECFVESLVLDDSPVPEDNTDFPVSARETDEIIIRKVRIEEPVTVA